MTATLDRLAAALADRYRIERELGQGGMATVYLAEDLKHKRRVAIKVLRPELAAVIGAERFLSEITTTANLQHPHILPLHDSGEVQGTVFYVMPFVDGESLRDRLDREKQLPIADAVRIASEVAGALGYAHRQGVIHRDIKPENILLHDGRALVADFGIALAASSAGSRMTETGMSLGTPTYMSPEQAMGERNLDARTDVYALGCVLYEMLTGDPPHTGSTAQSIIAKVISEKPVPPSRHRDTVSEAVEDAVLTALQKLPADRFAGAAEFAAALHGEATGTTRRLVAAAGGRARDRVHPVWPVALAVVALLGVWGWWRAASGTEPSPVIRYIVSLDSISESVDATGQLAISPDGDLLAYSTMDGPMRMRRRDAVALSAVPGTEGARTPFFSPDGKSIGYIVGEKLMVKPLSGGPAIVYADSLGGAHTPTWGADGYIYGIYRVIESSGSPIWRMKAEPGARLEAVTTVDLAAGELWHLLPEVLPDGRGVIFGVEHKDRGLLIAAIGPGETSHRVLTTGVKALYTREGHLLYSTRDGKLWAVGFDARTLSLQGSPTLVAEHLRTALVGPLDFAVSASGTLAYTASIAGDLREVVWVTRGGRVEPVDSTWQAPFAGPAVSPDGSRFAVSIRQGDASDVWVRDTRGGRLTRLTFGNGVNEGASWTPDGGSVTYLSGAERLTDVWSRRVDGGAGQVRLLESPRPISEASWSPVGGWLLVRTTTPTVGSGDILAFRPPGDTKSVPVLDSPKSEYTPTVSPDGRWMAYSSNETGRFEVYVVPFPEPGTARWQVSVAGGVMPRWSRGGGEIFFLDPSSHLIATTVTLRPAFAVGRSQSLFNAAGFVVDGFSRRNFDVEVGDRRFLMLRPAHGARSAHLVVVENWHAEGAR